MTSLQLFVCDPWESYMQQLVSECDEMERLRELEADLEDQQTLAHNEPDFFSARTTDPYWPPPELDQHELANIEHVPIELLGFGG